MGTKKTSGKTTETRGARDHVAARLDASTIARLEALRAHLAKGAPPGIEVRASDAMRAAIARGLAGYELEMSERPRAKALPRGRRVLPGEGVAPVVEVGP